MFGLIFINKMLKILLMFTSPHIALIYRNIRSAYDNMFIVHQVILPIMIIFIGGYAYSVIITEDVELETTGIPYLPYLVTGLIGYNMLWTCVISGTVIWNDRRNGMLEQILVMPFTRTDYIFSNILSIIVLGIIGATVIIIIGFPIIIEYVEMDIFGLFYILYSLINGAVIFGCMVIVLSLLIKSDDTLSFQIETGVVSGVFTVLTFTSTVFYPSESIPEPINTISYFNPLTYVVNIIRDSMFSEITFFTNVEVALLGGISLFIFLISWILIRRIRI